MNFKNMADGVFNQVRIFKILMKFIMYDPMIIIIAVVVVDVVIVDVVFIVYVVVVVGVTVVVLNAAIFDGVEAISAGVIVDV